MVLRKIRVILFFFVLVACFFPALAQGEFIKTGAEAAAGVSNLTEKVTQGVVHHTLNPAVPTVRWAQIVNLPGWPRVQVLTSTSSEAKVLSGRLLFGTEQRNYVTLDNSLQLYVPKSFAAPGKHVFRGLRLKNLNELEHIARSGMEVEKTHHEAIFCDYELSTPLSHSILTWGQLMCAGLVDTDLTFPVLVKIPLTPEFLKENPMDLAAGFVVFRQDVPAHRMSIMALLEINNRPGWYEVKLFNDKLLLTPEPSQKVDGILDLW